MKNRASDISALLANWEQVESAMQAATDAEGTAAAENEIYMNSLQGHLDTLSASWQALANTFMNSDFLKGLVDSATTLLNVLDSVVGTFGTIPTILTAISAGLSLKNVGRDKCFPYYNSLKVPTVIDFC